MISNFEDLYFDQLRDIYSAETQLVAALPEMITSATNDELRSAFSTHLEETKGHVSRLDRIFAGHGIKPSGEDCDAMRGLVKEARKHISDTEPGDVRDAVLIASANRVEHYEIAAYGAARAFAKALGFSDEASILGETLDEESYADKVITKIATGGAFSKGINQEAMRH